MNLSRPPRERQRPGYMDLDTLLPLTIPCPAAWKTGALQVHQPFTFRQNQASLLLLLKPSATFSSVAGPATTSVVSPCSPTPTPSSTPAPITSLQLSSYLLQKATPSVQYEKLYYLHKNSIHSIHSVI